jgi:peroxiredoxin Q/BCP
MLVTGVAAIGILAVIFSLNHKPGGNGKPGQYKFQVGSPGPGQPAPNIRLASTAGGTFDLASEQGKTVLLYFQEGLSCQPCWDQLKDIDASMPQFRKLGIDQVVSITTDPIGDIALKVSDEGITSPVLSDPDLAVSRAYSANQYGMMGESRDGHSFIVVGPDGKILWRADYGGSPDFTMYVPVSNLLSDLRQGMGRTG